MFLDLSKAFDTINHEIFCEKLYYFGIQDIALDWVKSYLENQTQFIQFGSSRSYNRKISCGIPQGSIDHFTVVCLVAWPLNESEAGGDLVLIETSLLFLCKFLLISMKTESLA